MSKTTQDNYDFVIVGDSIDLLTDDHVYPVYQMLGNGHSYPAMTTVDVNLLLDILRHHEANQGRTIVDIDSIYGNNNKIW